MRCRFIISTVSMGPRHLSRGYRVYTVVIRIDTNRFNGAAASEPRIRLRGHLRLIGGLFASMGPRHLSRGYWAWWSI